MLTRLGSAARAMSSSATKNWPLAIFATTPTCLLAIYWMGGEAAFIPACALASIISLVAVPIKRPHTAKNGRQKLDMWLAAPDAKKQSQRHIALIAIKFDDFATLKDQLGSDKCQAILSEATGRLRPLLRRDDAVVLLNDDTIVLGLRNLRAPETEHLLRLARRVQATCDEPFTEGTSRIFCSMSLGVASDTQIRGAQSVSLLEAAEIAADSARSADKAAVRVFSPDMLDAKQEERHRIETLTKALETGEIIAWFQPQLSTDGQNVIGFEALARWDKPGDGCLPPGAFLSDIMKFGLSQRLAEVVLNQALSGLTAWDAAGHSIPSISVNFSAEDLRNPHFADVILWELDRFGLSPDRLVVEVLESVIAEEHEQAITGTLSKLSAAGCQIDLDDFGTGFTSIINIRRFNVSRIKIDRRLISRLDRDNDQRRMVAALLSFSAKLGIEALAEGVETVPELEMLQKLGCPHIQGYVVAKPMPLDETLLWLNKQSDSTSTKMPNRAARAV